MEKKELKFLFLLALSLVFILFLSNNVLGFTLNFQQGANQVIQWISDILSPFFIALLGSGTQIFERVLMLAIMIALVYLILGKVPVFRKDDGIRKGPVWVVTIAVSLLATRVAYGNDAINAFLTRLSYTILGVTLTAAVPFVIYFFFVMSFEGEERTVLRKTLWLFYFVVFVGIWVNKYDEVGPLSWVYFFTALAALIFFFADGTIRRILVNQKMKQIASDRMEDYVARLREQIDHLRADVEAGRRSRESANRRIAQLNSDINAALKQ